jgi:4-hydroxy-3-methylbut-2-enyl diphosphate reductase
MREVILAKNAGFCFGVQRAVEEALKIQKQYNKKIYTLGPLIHNNDVVNYLETNNIYSIELNELHLLTKGDVIVIRSHGVSRDIMNLLNEKELMVINATCPFVTNIQKKVDKYSEIGYKIVILGDEKHPEVIGINGWCKEDAIITKDGSFSLKLPPKVCAVSQTTEKEENWKKTIDNLSSNVKELLAFNTICAATEVRQKSAYELSKEVDIMIVVGGKNSSNTTKLFEIAKSNCNLTIHIENASELPESIINNEKIQKIGITAGASTPDWIIKEVVEVMEGNEKMEDQLLLMNEMDRRFRIGDEVEGEILSINNDQLVISLVGYKSDGVIPFKELASQEKLEERLKEIKVGDKINAKVIKFKNEDNYVVLSTLELEKEATLVKLEDLFKSKKELDVVVTSAKEKGLVAYYNGVRIFIPSSQIDIKYIENKETLVNTKLTVRLIDFSKENLSKIVASRRVLLEEAKIEREKAAWESLSEGDVVKAEVKRFTGFGAFAEVDGIDGLIHLSQLSWSHVNSCDEVLKIGQIIDVKILSIDKEAKKLSLSIKALTPEPWSIVDEKYSEGSAVLGKVVRLNDFGAFIELEPGIDGLVHISKISHDHIKHPSEVLTIGEEVKCIILSIDKEAKKIALSIKDTE